ncbi:MAG TPA: Na+/H+ antiporter subunit D [Candidatus Tectomicrobia bacterium]|nr:Na+/H+ antiporter subunit D [Candidatus Tectomicrobia bacterium]
MTLVVALPILIPLCTGTVCLLCWGRLRLQRILSTASGVVNLAVALALLWHVSAHGILVSMMGNWPPPFGIALVADLLSTIMVVLSATMGLTVLLYSFGDIDRSREQWGYYPVYHLLLMGINGSFLTGDLFNLFVFFEVMLLASYVLLSLGGEPGQLQESFKYLVLNLLASTVFVASVGILYGVTGTLNMADLALKIAQTERSGLMTALSMLFLFVFGVKAAIFPLFFWLPDAYPEPPTAVSAIFGGLLTKVGVYALIRTFTLLFVQDPAFTHSLILVLAALTMIIGVLGAIVQNHFKRILSYHIISQIGYMILGLGLYTPLALAGSIFYIIHHITVKTALFLISGITERATGTQQLREMGGLLNAYPLVATLFMLAALSLAGMPPLSGFFAKLALLTAGVQEKQYVYVSVALLGSLLTLVSMSKIYVYVFWGEERPKRGRTVRHTDLLLPTAFLVLITVSLGLIGEPVFQLAQRSAAQLFSRGTYIEAVLAAAQEAKQ